MKFDIKKIDKKNLLIVGIGNTLKGDDGAGCEVIRRLKIKGQLSFYLLDAGSAPENYTKKIKDYKPKTIIFIDAVSMSELPGTIKMIDEKEISSGYFTTHNMPLNLFIDYIKQETKSEIFFVGIQPKSVKIGEGLSAEVQKSAEKLVEKLCMN